MSELLSLPEGIDLTILWALIGTSFAGSFITAAFGIGGGGLLLAIMAVLVPAHALIPVHGVVQLGSNAGRMLMFWREVFWPALPWFAVGTLVGSILGGVVVVELPAPVVQIGVGCFVIWSVFAKPPKWLRTWPWLAGGISSFLTMFFGATGLFVASYTKSFNLPRHEHVATHATLMTLQHGLKCVVFGILGFQFAAWGNVMLWMILAGAVGTWTGKRVLSRMEETWFRRALDTILVLISLRLIWSGASRYLG